MNGSIHFSPYALCALLHHFLPSPFYSVAFSSFQSLFTAASTSTRVECVFAYLQSLSPATWSYFQVSTDPKAD